MSNILFTANTRELGRCIRNERDICRLLLYFNSYETLAFCVSYDFACSKFLSGDLAFVFSAMLSS